MVDFNTSDFGFNYGKGFSGPSWDDASKIQFDPRAFDPKTKLFGDSSSDSDPNVGKWQRFGESMRMAGDVWNRRGDGSGYGSDRPISSIGGGGVQQMGDSMFAVYPNTFSPFTIAGTQGSKGSGSAIGGALGSLAVAAIPGIGPGLAAALPGIGAGIGGAFG